MPQAIVPAIVGGVAQLGGALLGSHSQSNAARAQERANREAMDYQRGRDAKEEAAQAAQAASDRKWWEFQMDMRTAAAKRAGYDVPDWRTQFGMAQPGQSGKSGTAPPSVRFLPGASPAPVTGAPPAPASGTSIGDILGVSGGNPSPPEALSPAENPIMSGGNTLGDIAGWSDWKRSLR